MASQVTETEAEKQVRGNGSAPPSRAVSPEDTSSQVDISPVVWDDSTMSTHFANVVNIQSTMEQVDLFFGTNRTWNINNNQRQVNVELTHRVILGPHAAKRLWMALGGVIKEYEDRYGEMKIGGVQN